jgi:AcrR family transcriptional regulator
MTTGTFDAAAKAGAAKAPADRTPPDRTPPDRTPPDRTSARERLLAAADELFYEEGVHTVGIDRVIERAGVAKATLYSAFGSKDELIRAYLTRRHATRQARLMRGLERFETPRERLLGPFDVLRELAAEPGFRGCAFVNASAESRPGGAVQEVSDESRAWTRSLFAELARNAGAKDPDQLARQLSLLYDGASVSARMDRDPEAAAEARVVAAALVDAAISS